MSQHSLTVVGVDPGLVHTGLVRLHFTSGDHNTLDITSQVIQGINVDEISAGTEGAAWVFVEAYRPRSAFQQDQRMVEGIGQIRTALPKARILNNTGVKKVVTKKLLDELDLWTFSTVTHHQDLRSAARIALLGMLKQDDLNALLTEVLWSRLAKDQHWIITHRKN